MQFKYLMRRHVLPLCVSWLYLKSCCCWLWHRLRRSSKTDIAITTVVGLSFTLLVTSVALLHLTLTSARGVGYLDRIIGCDKVNPFDYTFDLRPTVPCDAGRRDRVLLCVVSTVDMLGEREAVRNRVQLMSSPFTLVFFIGQANEEIKQHDGLPALVAIEANATNDVVQSSFPDSPEAQNLKTTSVLKWVAEMLDCSPSFVVITTATKALEDSFETRLDLLRGEMGVGMADFSVFLVGPLRTHALGLFNDYAYCDMYPRLTGYDWTIGENEVRVFPALSAEILFEAAQRTLWTTWSKCDVTALSAAMAGLPLLRMWAFWPYFVKDDQGNLV